jgi:glycosyltransferase involved in cell wall biosynthesis
VKILHIIETVSERFGGPVVVCNALCKALATKGVEVSLYTSNLDYPEGILDVPTDSLVEHDGYTIRYFKVQFRPYVFSYGMMHELRTSIRDFDLVHIHTLYRFPQAIAAYYAKFYRIPYIITPHGSLDPFLFFRRKRRLRKRIYEYLVEYRNLNRAAAVHFTTQEEMDLVRTLGVVNARGFVVPNGVDLNEYKVLPSYGRFKDKHGLKDKKIILHMGRINFKKGLDILVKSFARVARKRNDVHLVLAGPDNEGYGKKVSRWVDEEGIGDRTLFTGMLHGEEILAAYHDADIFALPSYSENFGMTVIEAMACGLPVVISDKVNIWREVQKGGAGLVDADKFANAFISLLDDKDSGRRMGDAGKVLVRSRYTWSSIVHELMKVYQDILKSPNYTLR